MDRLNTSVDQSDTTVAVASGGQDTAVQANPMVEIPSSCLEILTWIKRDPGEELVQNVEDTLSEIESMGSAFSRGNAADSVPPESQHPTESAGIPTGELTKGSNPPEVDTGSIPTEVDTESISTEVDTTGEVTDDNGGAEEQGLSFSALEKGMDI